MTIVHVGIVYYCARGSASCSSASRIAQHPTATCYSHATVTAPYITARVSLSLLLAQSSAVLLRLQVAACLAWQYHAMPLRSISRAPMILASRPARTLTAARGGRPNKNKVSIDPFGISSLSLRLKIGQKSGARRFSFRFPDIAVLQRDATRSTQVMHSTVHTIVVETPYVIRYNGLYRRINIPNMSCPKAPKSHTSPALYAGNVLLTLRCAVDNGSAYSYALFC